MNIITRKQAIEQGLKRYFTGKPCKSGHVAERYVDGGCMVCNHIRAAQWKQNNPEKFDAIQKKHYTKTIFHAAHKAKERRKNNQVKRHAISSKQLRKRYGIAPAASPDTRRAIEERLERKKLDQSLNLT
jgi:hypothetical protein